MQVDKYEVKILLESFINIASKKLSVKVEKDLIEWIEDYGDIIGIQNTNPDRFNNNKKRLYSILKNAQRLHSKVKNAKPSALQRNINFLAKTLGLDSLEKDILSYFIRKELNNIYDELIDTLGNGKFTKQSTSQSEIIAIILNKNTSQIKTAIKESSNLCKTALLSKDRSGDLEILSKLEQLNDIEFKTSKDIIRFLVGNPQKPKLVWKDFSYFEPHISIIKDIINSALQKKIKGINILLYGEPGTGKTEFTKTIAKKLNVEIYGIGEHDEDNEEPSRSDRVKALVFAQRLMKNNNKVILLFDEAEDMFNGYSDIFGHSSSRSSKVYTNRLLETNNTPVIWTTNNIESIDPAHIRRFSYVFEFKKLPKNIIKSIWRKKLSKFNFSKTEIKSITSNYSELGPATIDNICNSAKDINANFKIFTSMLDNIIKATNNTEETKEKQESEAINKQIKFKYELLNTDTNLKELTNKIKANKIKKFSLCLYGVPGTGKSEYAKELAKKLNIKVIYKRASDLLSMYIGESEKNIAKAFKEAKEQKAMLIFDEADSLLRDRRNAQRNWEITQVNEMLTWMENHEYPFVCTTNLMDSLDQASLRRFTFKIKYNYLKPEQVKKAFKHFFSFSPKNVNNLNLLTPGDFKVVKDKVEILQISDKKEIINMLIKEMAVKNKETGRKIGF